MGGANSTTKGPPLSDFKAWRKRLRQIDAKSRRAAEQMKATKQATRAPSLSNRKQQPNAFKREAYDYYCRLSNARMLDALKAFIRQRDGSRWDGHGDNGAQWVCRLIASEDQTPKRRQTRRRLAIEMEVARANDVRPELYLGFLYEAGPYQLIEAKWAATSKVYKWADPYRTPRSKLNKPKA